MSTEVEKLLDAFVDMRKEASVNACFGEPVKTETRTVIPVARIGYGFGMGARQGSGSDAESPEASPGGGGGGMSSSPLAIIEIAPDGVRVEPIVDEQKVALVGLLVGAWSVFWVTRVLMAIFGRRD